MELCSSVLLLLLQPLWFRVRVSHPSSHVTRQSCDHVICSKKNFISTFARTMTTSFSNVWLKLNWPQPSNHVTHLSCDHVIFAKTCIPSFTTPMTIKLSRVKGPHLLFQVTCRSSDHMLFEKRHAFINARSQNSAGDIKQKNSQIKIFLLLFKRY